MVLKREQMESLYQLIEEKSGKITDIHTQYKFIKIKMLLKPELEIYYTQLQKLKPLFKLDENNQIIYENGGFQIQEDKIHECEKIIQEINGIEVILPDIYFSLDELAPLALTFKQLELLTPFIKE